MSVSPLRILVITRSYPRAGDLYRYPFVHRRVLAYVRAGHVVQVFQPAAGADRHDYDGIACLSGGARDLAGLAGRFRPDTIAVHGLDENIWPVVQPLAETYPITAWLHGSEIPDFARQKAAWLDPSPDRDKAFQTIEQRIHFWRSLLAAPPPRFRIVLVSSHSIDLMRRDVPLAGSQVTVIHNPIDDELFAYAQKPIEQRHRILFVRPFDSPTYGNDLAVDALHTVVRNPEVDVTMVGDGPLFETTLATLPNTSAITIQRGFLTQRQIAELHRSHGIFLVPTRLDTQGVSRDEAMSSGLVPVTNRVAAIPEFVDDECAGLAEPDDADGLAARIGEMIENPDLFRDRSLAAAQRVRSQSAARVIIPRELELLGAMAND